ncbi:Rop guanine nucleotide exchange factor 6 [Heracleum sosnowskyi]|uniref:Rop guanine nucleotide exchange factor 6 n=1 Tax=Heracleum sosnowskyi TaxID=360622 RepID=A0AAD8IHI0_9APIA|nr:Rop guanine nucleotide exchange factor 6 [Heracleum sosnowskyi]
MSNKSPTFPMPDTQHFSDYGFQPHFDYFQVVEEARKHKRPGRAIDGLHFKLQKPTISHDLDSSKIIKKNKHCSKNNNKRWWKHALHFFKGKWTPHSQGSSSQNGGVVQCIGFSAPPVYITESRSGSTTPYRTTSRPMSCPRSPAMKGDMQNLPYISLKDINIDYQVQHHRISASSPMPIYLVT